MNSPEYCQNIYEAAKKVVDHAESDVGQVNNFDFLMKMWELLGNLKRALEGKENV